MNAQKQKEVLEKVKDWNGCSLLRVPVRRYLLLELWSYTALSRVFQQCFRGPSAAWSP